MLLHFAYTQYCENIKNTKFLQGCYGYYRIIPVPLFLTKMFNVCLMYQEDKTINLLISALNRVDIGATVQDETFMATLGKNTIFALNSKLEFCAKKSSYFNGLFCQPLHVTLTTVRLSWYIHDAASIISNMLKNPSAVELIKENFLSSSNSFTLKL